MLIFNILISAKAYTESYYFDVGTSYVIPFTYNTSGDISLISNFDDSYLVNDLKYSQNLSADIAFGVKLPYGFEVNFNYQYFNTNINTNSAFVGKGTDYVGTRGSYMANLTVNTLYVNGRYEFPNLIKTDSKTLRFFIQGGVGAANQSLWQQSIIFLNGGATASLVPKNVWQFAYTFGGGFNFQLSDQLFLDIGARFMNYGSYNSGVKVVDLPEFRMNESVKADLWTISPFLNLSIHL